MPKDVLFFGIALCIIWFTFHLITVSLGSKISRCVLSESKIIISSVHFLFIINSHSFCDWYTSSLFVPIYICKIVNEADLGKRFCDLRKSPVVLLVLLIISFKCSSNVSRASNIMPKCFWNAVWETILLLKNNGCL